MPAPGIDSRAIKNYFSNQRQHRPRAAEPVLGLGAVAVLRLRARDHAVRHGVDHPAAPRRRRAQARAAAEGGRGRLRQDQPVHALPDGRRSPRCSRSATCCCSRARLRPSQSGKVLDTNSGRIVLIVVTLTAGCTLLMWMGEQITKRGIGNGISILIFASIIADAPTTINAWSNGGPTTKLFYPILFIAVVAAVVFVQEGQRRIPVQYARGWSGRRMTAAAPTYMPLRVNMAGVIPIIFAAALLAFPPTIAQFFPKTQGFDQPQLPAAPGRLPPHGGVPDHRLHVLLHGGPVQPGRPGRQPAQVRGVHPRHQTRPADGAVSRPRAHRG